MFDFDPPTEFETQRSTRAESQESQETSVTPTASPRRRSAPLTASIPPPSHLAAAVEEENREPGQSQAEQQFMSLVGADLPSHRRAWKNDRTSWKVFTDTSNVSDDRQASGNTTEDDDAASDLSSESELGYLVSMDSRCLPNVHYFSIMEEPIRGRSITSRDDRTGPLHEWRGFSTAEIQRLEQARRGGTFSRQASSLKHQSPSERLCRYPSTCLCDQGHR